MFRFWHQHNIKLGRVEGEVMALGATREAEDPYNTRDDMRWRQSTLGAPT